MLVDPLVLLALLPAALALNLTPGADMMFCLAQGMRGGAALSIGGFVVNGTVGYFAGGIRRAMVRDMRIERVLRYVCESIFIGLAGKLAWDSRT